MTANPIHLDVQGIEPGNGAAIALYKHPMFVDGDGAAGIMVLAGAGNWTTSGIQDLIVATDSVSGDLTSVSVLATYESAKTTNTKPAGCAGGSLDTSFSGARCADAFLIAVAALALALAGRQRRCSVVNHEPARRMP